MLVNLSFGFCEWPAYPYLLLPLLHVPGGTLTVPAAVDADMAAPSTIMLLKHRHSFDFLLIDLRKKNHNIKIWDLQGMS